MNRLLLYGGLVLALLFGYEFWADHQREIGRAEIRAQVTENALHASKARGAEDRRVAAQHQEIIHEAHTQAESARKDAAAAGRAASRLQTELSAYRARTCPSATTPEGGEAAAAAERMLADVQRRLDEAADRITGFADQAHTAGLACSRSYDALTP